jgi:hypothetical protein
MYTWKRRGREAALYPASSCDLYSHWHNGSRTSLSPCSFECAELLSLKTYLIRINIVKLLFYSNPNGLPKCPQTAGVCPSLSCVE